jgi:hypothetical protein
MAKNAFVFYYDWLDLLEDQSFENKGKLIDAVSKLHLNGEDVTDELPEGVRMLFKQMKKQFERDFEKYNAVIEKRRNAGIKSGLARQEKTIEKPLVEAVPKVPKAPKPPKEPCLFEDFYTLYPRKEAKQNALKAYQKAVKQVSHETIIEGVSKYKQQIDAKQTEKQYIKQPATWLNQGCWDDDYNFEPLQNGKPVFKAYSDDIWKGRKSGEWLLDPESGEMIFKEFKPRV